MTAQEGKYVRVTAAGRRASLSDAKWEERAEELRFDALTNVRAAAEKWTGTIASVLAIFGIVVLVKGPEDISKVTGRWNLPDRVLGIALPDAIAWETVIGLLLGGAVAFAVLATTRAAKAAYGLPKKFMFTGAEVRKLYRSQAAKAMKSLRWARWYSYVAVVLLAGGIAITWYATPEEPTTASKVLATDATGIVACGVLQIGPDGEVLVREAEETRPVRVSLADASLTSVAACPGD